MLNNVCRKMKWLPAFASLAMLMFSSAAFADSSTDAKADAPANPAAKAAPAKPGYEYAPKDCDFRIDFPSEPIDGKRCAVADPDKCTPVTAFTHVFQLDATVNFTVTCNAAEKNMYEHYSGDVMRQTLIAMLGKDKLDNYETGFKEFPEAKQATILGTGKTGNSGKIYIAQLWIGHNSVFTVEGELVGEQTDEADKMFADILRSIRYKDWKQTVAGPIPTAAPAPADAKKDEPAATTAAAVAPTTPAPATDTAPAAAPAK